MRESDIDRMVAGWDMDRAIDLLVFDTPYIRGYGAPDYSESWEGAGKILDKLEELATRFQTADGFTHLDCGHYADHGMCVTRNSTDDSAELDAEPWSYHIHLGIVGENDVTPKHWGSGEEFFCARGATGPECIAKAAIKAFDPEFIRGQVEPEDKEITQFIGERLRQITKG